MKARYFAVAILLGGCISPEQAAYNRQMEVERQQQAREQYRANLLNGCDAMGFKRGTDAHANCVLTQHQQNIRLIGAAALQQQQQQAEAQRRAYQASQPAPSYNTNCSRDISGNTNCTTTRY